MNDISWTPSDWEAYTENNTLGGLGEQYEYNVDSIPGNQMETIWNSVVESSKQGLKDEWSKYKSRAKHHHILTGQQSLCG